MEQAIATLIADILHLDTVDVQLTRPDPRFGDYATSIALRLAKERGTASRELAEEIAEGLRKSGEFDEVGIAGPGFINLRLSSKVLANQLESAWSSNYGENQDGKDKTVIVEYPSPNMAKPYSIGHLRPGNQGWAAKRLMEATGWNVITDNHLGDYGAPFGIWVVGFLKFSSSEKLEQGGVYELGRVYIETKKALKDEKERGETTLADEVQEWLLKLERGDGKARDYSERFNTISLEHIHEIMRRLHISTDYELGEAFFAPRGKAAVQKLLDQGVAIKNDDGSIIVPLDDQGIEVPLLVQKSNGAALYATTDLATILYREENFRPDRIIHAVGAEQKFYFTQLFAMTKKIDINTDYIHLWFGTIDQLTDEGAREKMSSRKGVVLMEDLLDKAEEKAREIVAGREVSDGDVKKVALGAIKFSDFASDRRTNILFDWSSIFALSGYSGPYVQYAAVRVNKILSQHQVPTADISGYGWASEKNILLALLDYPAVVREAADKLEPHRVAAYVYNLARELNRYYESTPVATPEVGDLEKAARLALLAKVSRVFVHGLGLLGIEVPEKM